MSLQTFEILDRFELLYQTNSRLGDIRRLYIDKDLSSLFRLIENEELRKAVIEQNLHSIFRLLGEGEESDFRKAVVEKNLHSIFRLLGEGEESDFRKAILEKNLHSIFRMLGEGEESDFRKAVIEQNLHSVFRLLGEAAGKQDLDSMSYKEELRKAVIEQNLHSVFRLLGEGEESDFRKAVIEQNLHSIFRIFGEGEDSDFRKAVIEQNLHSIFRLLGEGEESDLRKAVVEENMHSIFRLANEGEESDFRKAVTEQNLHSIFRLLGEGEDSNLRKLILEDNTYKLWPILEEEADTSLVNTFKTFHRLDIKYDKDCFSRGQLYSKMWLIEELFKVTQSLGTIYLCAGWYATLSAMLFEKGFEIQAVRSFDIDESCIIIAEIFNKKWFTNDWQFKAIEQDINDIDYSSHTWQFWSTKNNRLSYPIIDTPNTIINTSCEHIENFEEWYEKIPSGKLVILQTNNYFEIEDHVNCVNDLAEFEKMSPMEIQCFTGALPLEHYTRFMRIGYK